MLLPDTMRNVADLIVADHVNHFSDRALKILFDSVDLDIMELDRFSYQGGILITACNKEPSEKRIDCTMQTNPRGNLDQVFDIWNRFAVKIQRETVGKADVLLHGAGIYGTWVANLLAKIDFAGQIHICDNNPQLWGRSICGHQVRSPADILSVVKFDCIIVCVRPDIAQEVVDETYPNLDISVLSLAT